MTFMHWLQRDVMCQILMQCANALHRESDREQTQYSLRQWFHTHFPEIAVSQTLQTWKSQYHCQRLLSDKLLCSWAVNWMQEQNQVKTNALFSWLTFSLGSAPQPGFLHGRIQLNHHSCFKKCPCNLNLHWHPVNAATTRWYKLCKCRHTHTHIKCIKL